MSLDAKARMVVARPISGDMVALVGSNRKLLIIPTDTIPVMSKGKGVILQRYKDSVLTDAIGFESAEGLSWVQSGGRVRSESDITPWLGKRGGREIRACRLPQTPPIYLTRFIQKESICRDA